MSTTTPSLEVFPPMETPSLSSPRPPAITSTSDRLPAATSSATTSDESSCETARNRRSAVSFAPKSIPPKATTSLSSPRSLPITSTSDWPPAAFASNTTSSDFAAGANARNSTSGSTSDNSFPASTIATTISPSSSCTSTSTRPAKTVAAPNSSCKFRTPPTISGDLFTSPNKSTTLRPPSSVFPPPPEPNKTTYLHPPPPPPEPNKTASLHPPPPPLPLPLPDIAGLVGPPSAGHPSPSPPSIKSTKGFFSNFWPSTTSPPFFKIATF